MPRLVQISIVRDERDVIEANLLHHAALGVAAAAVIDNGSSDGTLEILESLSRRMDLVVVRKPGLAKHDPSWRAELLTVARDWLDGDWVVPVDADEFWIPPGGDLLSVVEESAGFLIAQRDNVLPGAGLDQADLGDYRLSTLRVSRPYPFNLWRNFVIGSSNVKPDFPLLLSEVSPKVLCRLDGLEELGYGFHDARHSAGGRDMPNSCRLIHFPVRSFEQFQTKVRAHSRSHGMDWQTHDPTRSWHLKYWSRLQQAGRLEDEYRSFFLSPQQREALRQSGVIEILEAQTIFGPHLLGPDVISRAKAWS